jgi:hypothetical protein
MRRHSLQVAGAFALCFAAGSASMYAASRLAQLQSVPTTDSLPAAFSALDLSAEQAQQVADVFEKYQPRTDSVILSLTPRLAALADSMDVEIQSLLTLEQREKLESLRQPSLFLLKRKSSGGVRVDTLHTR